MRDRQVSGPQLDGTSALSEKEASRPLVNASASTPSFTSPYADLPKDHWLRGFIQIEDEILMHNVAASERGRMLLLSPSDNAGMGAKIQQLRDRHMETIAESIVQELRERPGVSIEGTLSVKNCYPFRPNEYEMSGLRVQIQGGKGPGDPSPLDLDVRFSVVPSVRGEFTMTISDPTIPGVEIPTHSRWDDDDTPSAIARDFANDIMSMPERRKDYLED